MLKIDHEFADQIPPLTEDEYQQLEANILFDGQIINPIIIWNGIIVDGHNRYRILQKHPELPYTTFEKKFSDRNEVMAWICKNQLGRRNLTPQQKKYLIGRQYKAEKATNGGSTSFRGNQHIRYPKSSEESQLRSVPQNEELTSQEFTSKRIARENHVSHSYVERAEQYADGVDAAEKAVPGIRQEIFSGEICPVDSAVKAVAVAPPEERETLARRLRNPDIQRRGKPRRETEEERITRKVTEDMESTVPKRRVNENSMLETLRGVAETMIRSCNRCFDLFPTLLTEQVYRSQVMDILQEPKNYILNLESEGGTNQ